MNPPMHRGRLILRGFTLFAWIGAFVLTHIPRSQIPRIRVGDKFAHFSVYLVLASLLSLCLWNFKRSIWIMAGIVLAAGCLYGAIDELTQPLVGRFASLDDWFADIGGTLTAVSFFTVLRLITSWRTAPASPGSAENRHD